MDSRSFINPLINPFFHTNEIHHIKVTYQLFALEQQPDKQDGFANMVI